MRLFNVFGGICMRKWKLEWLVPVMAAGAFSFVQRAGAQSSGGAQPGRDLTWAFPVADKEQPPAPDPKEEVRLPGSAKTYTRAQIDDLTNPPDWYPNEHAPAPVVVTGAPGR